MHHAGLGFRPHSPMCICCLCRVCAQLEGVLSSRLIWQGTVQEGPANFVTKM
jgi:hypothetical protein